MLRIDGPFGFGVVVVGVVVVEVVVEVEVVEVVVEVEVVEVVVGVEVVEVVVEVVKPVVDSCPLSTSNVQSAASISQSSDWEYMRNVSSLTRATLLILQIQYQYLDGQ